MKRDRKIFRLTKINYIPREVEPALRIAYPKELPTFLKIKAIKRYLRSEGKSLDPLPELAPVALEEEPEKIPVFEIFPIN